MNQPLRFARNTWRRILATVHYSLDGSVRGPFSLEHFETEAILRELAGSSLEGPSLTVYDLNNVNSVNFLADPFLFVTTDALHLFFEVRHQDGEPTASIGHAITGSMMESYSKSIRTSRTPTFSKRTGKYTCSRTLQIMLEISHLHASTRQLTSLRTGK